MKNKDDIKLTGLVYLSDKVKWDNEEDKKAYVRGKLASCFAEKIIEDYAQNIEKVYEKDDTFYRLTLYVLDKKQAGKYIGKWIEI